MDDVLGEGCVDQQIFDLFFYGTNGNIRIQKEGDYAGSYEFKLKGLPFYATNEQAIQSRMLLCHVLGALRSQGFKLYSSVSCSIQKQNGMDLESWIFRRVGPAWS